MAEPTSQTKKKKKKKRRSKAYRKWADPLLAWLAAHVMKLIFLTLRVRLEDRLGYFEGKFEAPAVWVCWHNRILMLPYAFRRWGRHRKARAMTSASRDGNILAAVVSHFKVGAIRGSSSRRGGEALLHAVKLLRSGQDVAIIPDGPRGPRYRFAVGPIVLAQKCGAALAPFHVHYEKAWQLRTWDRFMIPKPFSRVTITLGPAVDLPVEQLEDHQLEAARLRAEAAMIDGVQDRRD